MQSDQTSSSFAARAFGVVAFGVAFGYVEAAVVVYLRTALGLTPAPEFPLEQAVGTGDHLVAIEIGRELATLVMLAAVGSVAGASRLERLAWASVAFGAWDIAYYGWLWVFVGWPSAPTTWDVLFLVPVPWVAPVWAPIAVSVALVGVGLVAARRLRSGQGVDLRLGHVAGGLAGGTLVVLSFVLDAPNVIGGGVPQGWAWPFFIAGMLAACAAASHALRPGGFRRSVAGNAPTGPVELRVDDSN